MEFTDHPGTTMTTISLSEREMLDVMTAITTSGDYSFILPIVNAAYEGRIELAILPRGAPWPTRDLRRSTLPTLVLIGDDDHTPSGSAGWPTEIRTWARHAMIHAAAGSAETYRMALHNCLTSQRYVLVETDSAHLEDWLTFFAGAPSAIPLDVVRPAPGETHPKPVPRSSMQ